MSQKNEVAKKIALQLADALAGRLDAVYEFGLEYGKGPRGPAVRLLVLVDKLDPKILDKLATLQRKAREDDAALRVDTFANLQASTDVFPVLTFELLDNRTLLHGDKDLLEDLELHPSELRMGIEHSLRATHRDLMRAYLDGDGEGGELGDRERAIALRRAARRTLMMIEASLIVAGAKAPETHSAKAIMTAAREAKILTGEQQTWDTWMKFGDYDKTLEHDALVSTHAEVLMELQTLIGVVDGLDAS